MYMVKLEVRPYTVSAIYPGLISSKGAALFIYHKTIYMTRKKSLEGKLILRGLINVSFN